MLEMMKGYRNGLVGNYYEPQRIDYSDAISELEKAYEGLKTWYTRREYIVESYKLEKGESLWQ